MTTTNRAPWPSQEAIDFIIACEVTSEAVYRDRLAMPHWPGGASGITIGIGYDLGYCTKEQFLADWPELSGSALVRAIGAKGDAARDQLATYSHIRVPWEDARRVFGTVSLGRTVRDTIGIYPRAAELHPDCLGALVSLVYNRGTSLSDPSGQDRRREMREIAVALLEHRDADVPGLIRSMKRLWDVRIMRGLHTRRDREADLFQAGLAKQG